MNPDTELSENKLLVRKIQNGIVIDHIPHGKAQLVLKILNLDPDARVVVASNVLSTKHGKKDIIKIEGKYLTSKEIDLISLVAPAATISRIDVWKVKEKHDAQLPGKIEGVFKCPDPSCPTNAKYPKKAEFKVIKSDDINKTKLQCVHCGSYLYYGSILDALEGEGASISGGLVSKEKIQKEFLELMLKKGALKVAKSTDELFIMKSKRASTYFVNLRALTDGESLAKMKWIFSSYIALLLEQKELEDFDFVFGPAYAGINLATLISEGLNELYGMHKRYLYDRKEVKDYGDLAADKLIVGAGHFKPGQKILIVDDVVTTGKTKAESMEKLKRLGDNKVVGLVLGVDRQEKMGSVDAPEEKSAVDYIHDEFGIKVFSILNVQSVFNALKDTLPPEIKQHWIDYYEKYGVVKLK